MITEPGFYVLGGDVVDTPATVWLEIRVSGVTIDGMGHTIDSDGKDPFWSHGILVRGDGPLSDITIQNVKVTDFAYGISLYDVTRGHINTVSVIANTWDGIQIVGGSDNLVECSLIHRDDDGVNMTATTRAVVRYNTVTENFRGSGVHVSRGCVDVLVTGNEIRGNDEGIEVERAVNTTIRANRIRESKYYGLNLSATGGVTFVDNYLSNRENLLAPSEHFVGTWSVSPTVGPNVMGNRLIGGNYWGTPGMTGFSDVTPDSDRDGFADGVYVLPDGMGTDRFPLGPYLGTAGWSPMTTPLLTPTTTASQAGGDASGPTSGAAPQDDDDGYPGPVTGSQGAGTVHGTTAGPGGETPATMTTAATTTTTAATTTTGTPAPAATATAPAPTPTPGFGAAAALAGLAAVAFRALRRD